MQRQQPRQQKLATVTKRCSPSTPKASGVPNSHPDGYLASGVTSARASSSQSTRVSPYLPPPVFRSMCCCCCYSYASVAAVVSAFCGAAAVCCAAEFMALLCLARVAVAAAPVCVNSAAAPSAAMLC